MHIYINKLLISGRNNHVALLAWVSLTFSCHSSLLFIAPEGLPGYILYRHRAVVYRF